VVLLLPAGACRATVGGGADEPGLTATMPRQRPGAIAASPQPPARLAGIPAFLPPATGRGGPLVSDLPPAGPIGTGRPATQPAVRLLWRRLSLPGAAGPSWGLLLAGRAVGRLPGWPSRGGARPWV